MAPGKTHVKLKLKNKFQTRKRNSSGVRKAKNNSLPKKKVGLSKELITSRNVSASCVFFLDSQMQLNVVIRSQMN